jgi:hypothetical protein
MTWQSKQHFGRMPSPKSELSTWKLSLKHNHLYSFEFLVIWIPMLEESSLIDLELSLEELRRVETFKRPFLCVEKSPIHGIH